jgi:polyvinyl alcohol dehydrogenase (cytochrome)
MWRTEGRMPRAISTFVALAVLGVGLTGVPAQAKPAKGPCGAPSAHPGGDWRSYGHDLANTRTQPRESTIGPDTVGDLQVAWVLDAGEEGGGVLNSTPIVADGCLYVAPSSGRVIAVNADTGKVVWTRQMDVSPPGYGGGVVGAPAVAGDSLIVVMNREGSPYLASLRRSDGKVEWTTVIDRTETAITNASVTVYKGMAFVGFSGSPGGTPAERGGFVIADVGTGKILAKTWTIPRADFKRGYAGASIWSTAAVDTKTGYAYVGAGNPHSDHLEHQHANSLLKIDLNRGRRTFGKIVDAYKGRPDQYVEGAHRQPVCRTAPDVYYFASFSATCTQLDLDFGASPNLFRDERGYLMVGALQKAGVYHSVFATTMQRGWTTVAGAPCFACNAGNAAFDGQRLHVPAAPPGQVWALDTAEGDYQWLAPLGGVVNYYSVSTANGVVYTMDGNGLFNALDAETGRPLLKRSTQQDGGAQSAGYASSGIAIARNTVYAVSGSQVIAYRL